MVVSALSSLRDRARAAELGADAFCAKPFNVEDLLGVVHGLEDLDDLADLNDRPTCTTWPGRRELIRLCRPPGPARDD